MDYSDMALSLHRAQVVEGSDFEWALRIASAHSERAWRKERIGAWLRLQRARQGSE